MARKGRIEFEFRNDVVRLSGFDIDEIKSYISELTNIFKREYVKLFPTKINDNLTLDNLIRLSQNLKKLKGCDGFDRHIGGFKDRAVHTHFVTEIAAHLVSKVDKLILEPPIPGKRKRSDLYVEIKDQHLFIECKSLMPTQYDYSKEHRNFFNLIRPYIKVPHQIDIKYKKNMSEKDIKELGITLQKRLPKITDDGTIIHNEGIEVGVIKRNLFGSRDFSTDFLMHIQDINENCFYPANAYGEAGLTVSIAGPVVDFSKSLKKKIKDSRQQSAYNEPYILAIDTSMILGNMKENIKTIQTSFQPDANTRFSGVLLVRPMNMIKNFTLELNFITNPFTKYPLQKEAKLLFNS